MTKYTEEEIAEAFMNIRKRDFFSEDMAGYLNAFQKQLLAKLRNEPKFAEGQVVFAKYLEDDVPTGDYVRVEKVDMDKSHGNARPLNQAEVGPDWVPKDAVMELRDIVGLLSNAEWLNGRIGYPEDEILHRARMAMSAAEAFDKKVNHDS